MSADNLFRSAIVLCILLSWVHPFRLFHTTNDGDHDCLYRYARTRNQLGRHLISYCIRSVEITHRSCHGTSYTFNALRHAQVTVMDLSRWHSPVDLIDVYADYLESGENGEQVFCNCSSMDVFGVHCQYRFALDLDSFEEIVEETFLWNHLENPLKRRFDVRQLSEDDLSCYVMFNCTRYVDLCLDWRQICDGLRDCTDGRDEENCLAMEMNECDPVSEYRCRNGFCIPKSFSFDLTMDCLDLYDEQSFHDHTRHCHHDSSIHCDEHSCALAGCNCGDGSCFEEYGFIESEQIYEECHSQRNSLYVKQISQYQNETLLNKACWQHMWCLLGLSCLYESSDEQSRCHESVQYSARICRSNRNSHLSCPEMFFFPPTSFVLPSIQLLYKNERYIDRGKAYFHKPSHLCFNRSIYNISTWSSTPPNILERVFFQGYECWKLQEFGLWQYDTPRIAISDFTQLAVSVHSLFSHLNASLNNSTSMYRCPTGHQISFHRLADRYVDCFPHAIDESRSESCHSHLHARFRCLAGFSNSCIPRRFLRDHIDDCLYAADELFPIACTGHSDCQYFRHFDLQIAMPIFYHELCNGFHALKSTTSDKVETDETNCEDWPCNARSIRCNGVWNRPNGCDEFNCPKAISNFIAHHVGNCSKNEHYCFRYNSSDVGCLPGAKANDGFDDCLFSSDERLTSSEPETGIFFEHQLYLPCFNHSDQYLHHENICDGVRHCPLEDDELLCPWQRDSSCIGFMCKNGTCLPRETRCNQRIDCDDAEDEWLCDVNYYSQSRSAKPFVIEDFSLADTLHRRLLPRQSISTVNETLLWSCHRGILIDVAPFGHRCLCPASYYGARCQYQSERLTVSFRVETEDTSSAQAIYQLVFYLLDEQETPVTVETLIYAPAIHSSLKHLLILAYPRNDRSLTSSTNLSLRIDSYLVTRSTVDAFVSWFFPVQFPFLPVNRLAVQLIAKQGKIDRTLCAGLNCQHGTCQMFSNVDRPFCRCFSNWTGLTCNRTATLLECHAPAKSILVNGHPLCICPLERAGRRCQVSYDNCDGVPCQNSGMCVSLDVRTEEHVCVCAERYFGDRCQYIDAHLHLRIPFDLDSTSLLILHSLHSPTHLPGMLIHRDIHFVRNVQANDQLVIATLHEQYLPPFIFAQYVHESTSFYGSYFLLAVLADNRTTLTTSIVQANRCPHVNERLNDTVMKFEWLKRVKFYHRYLTDVKCFYDEVYMCFVDEEQMPDCLHFNHGMSNCTEHNYCENAGRCFERRHMGQLNFACVCPECVTGVFCQIQITQFSFTLDSMLAEIIVTDGSWKEQPPLLKSFAAFVLVMFIIGILSNLMSVLTFMNSEQRLYGCGHYLLLLSIVAQLAIITLVARFVHLLVGQMTIIENQRWLTISCTLFDVVLSLLVSFWDWLMACIAYERTSQALLGIRFNRRRSVRAVKLVIPLLCITLVLTSLPRPLSQTLIADPRNNQRFWCVIKFREAWLQTYTIVTNVLNTIVPFLINLISAVTLLVSFTRTKQRLARKTSSWVILKKQVHEHKDLLISPLLMIAFKVPSIIVMLLFKCAKSSWQFSLALIVYCLALLPLTTTFLIFVLPSRSYRQVFDKQWKKLCRR